MFIILMVMVTCCSCSLKKLDDPGAILYDGEKIVYGTTQKKAEKVLGNGVELEIFDKVEYDKSIKVVYGEKSKTDDVPTVRLFEITDSDVKTYNNISVGDKIKDVLKLYKYEDDLDDNFYSVTFNGKKEVDVNEGDVDIFISYCVEGEIVTKILIYDPIYAEYLK